MTFPLLTRQVDTIIIHCADTPNGKSFTAKDIDGWHRQRGWFRNDQFRIRLGYNPGLTSIGYHYVIGITGQVETGRHPNEIGAHVAGHNAHSIGICLVGNDRFTPEQWSSLDSLITEIAKMIVVGVNPVKNVKVVGHCQLDTHGKTCPNFDVPAWQKRGRVPETGNVLLTD
jgi:hypothetical protein